MNISKRKNKKRNEGFIALMSSVIIAAVILVFTVTLSYSSFFVRFNLLDSEFKDRSVALAEGCVDSALLNYAINSSYSGNEFLNIGSDSCFVRPIYESGSNINIETQAIFQNSYTNLKVTINKISLAVVSWSEVPHF
ncbi:MAG: hypothetical protein Q8L47_03930 [bacterium]|nr:hypothetical protein [bacterium]